MFARLVIFILLFLFTSLGTADLFAESDTERMKRLEEKLNQVTEELEELKQTSSENDRLEAIEEKLSILAEEINQVKAESVGEEDSIELKEVFGGAPGASKVYLKAGRGLSIGGYGELAIGKIRGNSENNIVDAQRVVLYVGYKFTDHIIFNSEIEFEHGSTSANLDGQEGSVSVEFAYLDFLLKDYLNIRGGVLLVPVGITNEQHEPTTFYGVFRPSVETQIIPSTWRENGIGLHGGFDFSSAGNLSYKAFLMNSADSRGFKASNNRGIRTKGNRSRFNDVAFVSRLDYYPIPSLRVGGSMYLGNTGQDVTVDNAESQFNGDTIKGFWQIYEADAQFKWRGLDLRGLITWTFLDDVDEINANLGFTGDDSVGSKQFGYYIVAAYNLLGEANFQSRYLQNLSPFFRFEDYDTQKSVPVGFSRNPANARTEYTFGLDYKPIPNVVVKIDYQFLDNDAGDDNNQVNFGLGYVF